MIQSWLKRQIILAAILVPLSSIIFIVSFFILNQITQELTIVLKASLTITVIAAVLVFFRLYQINFFRIAKSNTIRKFWNIGTSVNIKIKPLYLILTSSLIVIIVVSSISKLDIKDFLNLILAVSVTMNLTSTISMDKKENEKENEKE